MEKAIKVLIFTDLDGSLLHRDTFKFDEIKDYLKQLISKGIFIIPNTSKTEKEILQFNYELGSNLPFISENGSAINGLELLNSDLPKELILSREKDDLLNIFKNINDYSKKLIKEKDFIFLISLMIIDESDNSEYFIYKYNISNEDKKRIRFLSNIFFKNLDKDTFKESNLWKILYFN